MAETELMKTPTFRSLAQRFDANVGDTVRLPCLVDRLEGFVILWKKGADIITVASQVLDKVGTPRQFEYQTSLESAMTSSAAQLRSDHRELRSRVLSKCQMSYAPTSDLDS